MYHSSCTCIRGVSFHHVRTAVMMATLLVQDISNKIEQTTQKGQRFQDLHHAQTQRHTETDFLGSLQVERPCDEPREDGKDEIHHNVVDWSSRLQVSICIVVDGARLESHQ